MATHYVFTCEPANQAIGTDGLGNSYGSCATGGAWIEVDISPWYMGGVNQESFGQLLLAGTSLLALAYSVLLIKRVMQRR